MRSKPSKFKRSQTLDMATSCERHRSQEDLAAGEELDEDEGFQFKQLMVNFGSMAARRKRRLTKAPSYAAKVTRATLAWASESSPDERKGTVAALRLLNCVAAVLQTTAQRRFSGCLQDLMINWLQDRPMTVQAVRPDLTSFVHGRQNFFQCYRADTLKWEGENSVPKMASKGGAGEANANESPSIAAAAAAAAGYTETGLAPNRKPPSIPLSGAHTKVPSKDQRERFSAFTLAREAEQSLARVAEQQAERERRNAVKGNRSSVELKSFAKKSLSVHLPAEMPAERSSTVSSSDSPAAQLFSSGEKLPASRPPSLMLELPGWQDFGASRRLKCRGLASGVDDPCGRFCTGCSVCSYKAKRTLEQSTGPPVRPKGRAISSMVSYDDLETMVEKSKTKRIGSCGSLPILKPLCALTSADDAKDPMAQLDPVDPPWARLPEYEPPYSCSTTVPIVQTSIWRYLQECQRSCVLPRLPAQLLEEARRSQRPGSGHPPAKMDFKGWGIVDTDLTPLLQVTTCYPRLGGIDLSSNSLSDVAVHAFLTELPCNHLAHVDLSECGAGRHSLSLCTERLMDGMWSRVKVLRLRGCVLGNDAAWDGFAKAVIEQDVLTELCFADMRLGNPSQGSVRSVARIIAEARALESLDLSGNFLLYDGCEALAAALTQQKVPEPRARKLRFLDVSCNSWTHAVQPRRLRQISDPAAALGDSVRHLSTGAICEDMPTHNPLALLCESLAQNHTLKSLRMAQAGVDYATDCVLLSALLSNTALHELDLDNNPHGIEGMKMIMRFVAISKTIENVSVKGFSVASLGPGVLPNEPFSPSGHYKMDLTHPQHRAVLSWLLYSAEQAGMKPPQSAFTVNSWSRPGTEWNSKRENGRGFCAATGGRLDFAFDIPLALDEEPTAVAAVNKWLNARRLILSLNRFVALFSMYDGLLTDGQRETFTEALGQAFRIKTCQLQKFLQTSPKLGTEIARSLYGSVTHRDPVVFFDILNYKSIKKRFRMEAYHNFKFNGLNPTDHYVLDLSLPLHRYVAEQLHVVCGYDRARAERSEFPDVSQHNNWEGARNVLHEGKRLKSFCNFNIQDRQHGELRLDYASPPSAVPSKKSKQTTQQFFRDVLDALQTSSCSFSDRVSALRSITELLVLTCSQVRQLIEVFPNPGTSRTPQYLWSLVRQVMKSPGLSEIALGNQRIQTGAFPRAEVEVARVEALTALFGRCCDTPTLCSRDCLYDSQLFDRASANELCRRLGVLRTFDALGCCVPWRELYGVRPKAKKNMPTNKAALRNTLNCDKNVHLQQLRAALDAGANPETASFDLEPGRRYEFKLNVYEERRCAHFLFCLEKIEGEGEIARCGWSERPRLMEDGYDFIPPPDWVENGPDHHGTLYMTYLSKMDLSLEARRSLAERFCGWERRERSG